MEYLKKAEKAATDPELKAHIAFAAAKNAQQYGEDCTYLDDGSYFYRIVFSPDWFDELKRYQGTDYYADVMSNCVYFKYYLNGSY